MKTAIATEEPDEPTPPWTVYPSTYTSSTWPWAPGILIAPHNTSLTITYAGPH